MKKYYFALAVLALTSAGFFYASRTSAQVEVKTTGSDHFVSPHLVISQFQAGRATPNFEDEFVEIHNTSSSPVDLNGYRLVYRSATGQNDVPNPFAVWTTSTIIPAGGFYLVAAQGYDGSVAPNATYNPATCQCSMSGNNGGLAIRLGANNAGAIIDSVAWGTVTNGFNEGTATTAHPVDANDNSKARLQNGCQDTDSNANDFATLTPATPRNASSAPVTCSGSGTNLFAAINANPNFLDPGGNTLITVSVIPATTPPSTGITVVGNLTDIGGVSSQAFFDNGTNGDVTPGDNVFSFRATIPVAMSGGVRNVTAVASDAQARTVNLNQNITINGCPVNDQHLALGNPSNATGDVLNENNYLMAKPEYSLAYNRSRAISNWVAWRLDGSWLGTTERQDDFRPDPALPAGWYQVLDNDYSGSGFDRGHSVPSGDRTCSVPANSATFLMTNIMPQAANNNQGPWEELETYCRTLVGQGNELYIYTGGAGQGGTGLNGFATTIASGRVTVPSVTWKVIVVLPVGSNDADRVYKTTRIISVIMPNHQSIGMNTPWRNFRTNVKAVEALTGLTFFTNVRPQARHMIKQRRDTL
jgi:endonuclease G